MRFSISSLAPRALDKDLPSLQHFILRSEVKALYRSYLRELKGITSPEDENEWKTYIRSEFDKCRHYVELEQIKYALQNGKAQFKRFSSLINLAKEKK